MSHCQNKQGDKRIHEVAMFLRKPTLLWAVVSIIFFTNLYASHPQQHQVVNGIAIYLTIIPAEMLRGHPKEHPESDMHTRSRIADINQHHIMVSLFNAKNGTRLQNKIIKAEVSGTNYKGPVKKLELMVMGATRSYGNFFAIPLNGTYQVELEIQQEGKSKVIKAVFQYASI